MSITSTNPLDVLKARAERGSRSNFVIEVEASEGGYLITLTRTMATLPMVGVGEFAVDPEPRQVTTTRAATYWASNAEAVDRWLSRWSA